MFGVLNVIIAMAKSDISLGKAAIIAVLGLVIVFAVLAVLVGILTLFKLVFNIKVQPKKKQNAISAIETATQDEADDGELVAVIAAAIACLNGEETVKAPFRIKSIKKLK